MDRRTFLSTLGVAVLAAPRGAESEQAARVHRIGLLSPPPGPYVSAFEDSLRQLGYVKNSSLLIEIRHSGTSDDRLHAAVADLLRLNVEIIVTGPNRFIDAAREATTTIPIVMVYGRDPVGRGYIASLAQPNGNITGLTWEPTTEIFGKHVEFLTELSPRPSRIAGIVDPASHHPSYWTAAESAASRRGVVLQYVQVEAESDVPKAFQEIVRGRAGAVMIFGSPSLWTFRAQIANLAKQHALPTIYTYREGPDAGGLMSYGTNLTDSWRRAASYVDKILKGAKPGDLPVEQPTKFELVVNLKTANSLGLTIPPAVLARADAVIE